MQGVGWDQQSISDWVTAIKLVDSSGEVKTFKYGADSDSVMQALQVNLGLFGIITEITMKVQPAKLVEVRNLFPTVLDTFFNPEKLREIVTNNWSCEMFWFPFNSMKLVQGHGDLIWATLEGRVSTFTWNPMVDQVWVRAINPLKPGQLHLPPVGRYVVYY